jgi:A/G-specific adenine glycosylase
VPRRQKRLPVPTPPQRQWFRRRLLTWYRKHGRDLPWRETRDPYRILVSEIMLQQTQVDRVLPKYEEWLLRYPTFDALAEAPEAEVVRTWYPLGYNIRPRRLHAIAREAVSKYGGALMSFAFGKRAAILDTNVARVLFRVFIARGDPRAHATERHLWDISRTVLPHRHVFDFNQALMDFGATVCSARKPECLICPMTSKCRAYPFNPDHER